MISKNIVPKKLSKMKSMSFFRILAQFSATLRNNSYLTYFDQITCFFLQTNVILIDNLLEFLCRKNKVLFLPSLRTLSMFYKQRCS